MAHALQVRRAVADDLDWIHELRHRVYAKELGQHAPDPTGRLRDSLDGDNVYLVVARGADRLGFVSITPPWAGRYGIERYLTREELPLLTEDALFEVRILTVEPRWRSTRAAPLLMFAALRWIASRGGRRVVVMGRTELLDMYQAVGLRPTGHAVYCGALSFEVLTGAVIELMRTAMSRYSRRGGAAAGRSRLAVGHAVSSAGGRLRARRGFVRRDRYGLPQPAPAP